MLPCKNDCVLACVPSVEMVAPSAIRSNQAAGCAARTGAPLVASEILKRIVTSSPSWGARAFPPATGETLSSTAMPCSVTRRAPGDFADATLSAPSAAPNPAKNVKAARQGSRRHPTWPSEMQTATLLYLFRGDPKNAPGATITQIISVEVIPGDEVLAARLRNEDIDRVVRTKDLRTQSLRFNVIT